MAEKKKYWIKLEKDFLKSNQIQVIRAMTNGKDYIIFYLALMLESTSTEGHLRLNELVPLDVEMLATITDTNIDTVRVAIQAFEKLGMLQILDDGTIFLPGVPPRLGKESESAERVRLYREKQQALHSRYNVTKTLQCNNNKEKDIYQEKKKEKNVYLQVPTLDEITAYCAERKNKICPQTFFDYYQSRDWRSGKNKITDWQAAVRLWEQNDTSANMDKTDKKGYEPKMGVVL